MCRIVMTWRELGRRKCFLAFHENRMWEGGIHQRTRRYDNAVDTARFSIIYSLSNPSRWTISLKALLNFLHPNPPPSLLTFIYWASGRLLRLTFMVLLQKIFCDANKFLLTVIQSQFMWELCLEYCNLLSKEEQTAVFLSDPYLPKLLFVASCALIMPSNECYHTFYIQFNQILQCVSQFESF